MFKSHLPYNLHIWAPYQVFVSLEKNRRHILELRFDDGNVHSTFFCISHSFVCALTTS